jgi:probable rRNA maturation factor
MQMATIQFFSTDVGIPSLKRKPLRTFLGEIFTNYKRHLDGLTYIFCTDQYLLSINKQFLQHDYFTDIITFDLSNDKKLIQGEIYISIDRVKDNAKSLGVSYQQELHRVIFHGVLHLCGLKDKTKAQKEAMRAAEEVYLHRYFNR